jgi:hypothetical protein
MWYATLYTWPQKPSQSGRKNAGCIGDLIWVSPRNDTHFFCLHSRVQNSVPWHPFNCKEAGTFTFSRSYAQERHIRIGEHWWSLLQIERVVVCLLGDARVSVLVGRGMCSLKTHGKEADMRRSAHLCALQPSSFILSHSHGLSPTRS